MALIRRILLIFVLALSVSGHAYAAGFHGEWSTNLGKMILSQSGKQVTGSYGSGGRVSGTVVGTTLRGTYTWSSKRGEFELSLADDARSFSGRWWRPGAKGNWTGERIGEPVGTAVPLPEPAIGSEPPAVPTPPGRSVSATFRGEWATSLGRMTLRQTGRQVTGSYGSGSTVTGTVSGSTLRGTYTWANKRSEFELSLSDDARSFSGRWWRPGAKGNWTGKRIGEPVDDTFLVDNWNRDLCGTTGSATAMIPASGARVERIVTWYRWDTDQQHTNAEFHAPDGRTLAAGQIIRGSCDPYQPEWCEGVLDFRRPLGGGPHILQVTPPRICQNATSGGMGFIRIEGQAN